MRGSGWVGCGDAQKVRDKVATAVSTEEPGYFLKLICGRMLATVMTARHFQSLVSFLAGSHDLLCKQEEEKRSGEGGVANCFMVENGS